MANYIHVLVIKLGSTVHRQYWFHAKIHRGKEWKSKKYREINFLYKIKETIFFFFLLTDYSRKIKILSLPLINYIFYSTILWLRRHAVITSYNVNIYSILQVQSLIDINSCDRLGNSWEYSKILLDFYRVKAELQKGRYRRWCRTNVKLVVCKTIRESNAALYLVSTFLLPLASLSS